MRGIPGTNPTQTQTQTQTPPHPSPPAPKPPGAHARRRRQRSRAQTGPRPRRRPWCAPPAGQRRGRRGVVLRLQRQSRPGLERAAPLCSLAPKPCHPCNPFPCSCTSPPKPTCSAAAWRARSAALAAVSRADWAAPAALSWAAAAVLAAFCWAAPVVSAAVCLVASAASPGKRAGKNKGTPNQRRWHCARPARRQHAALPQSSAACWLAANAGSHGTSPPAAHLSCARRPRPLPPPGQCPASPWRPVWAGRGRKQGNEKLNAPAAMAATQRRAARNPMFAA